MATYVLFTGLRSDDDYCFVGPFANQTHAFVWAEQQHPEDWWYVLDLDDPSLEPPILKSPSPAPVLPDQGRCSYILCWNESSFHLIGPFSDNRAIGQYVNDVNNDDCDPDDCSPFGPYNDLRWFAVKAEVPPEPPTVLSSPPMQPVSPEMVSDEEMYVCKRARFIDGLCQSIVDRVEAAKLRH